MLSTQAPVPFESVQVGQQFHLALDQNTADTAYLYTRLDASDDPVDDNCLIEWPGGETTTLIYNSDLVFLLLQSDQEWL